MTHKTRKVRKQRRLRTKTDRKSRKKILRKSRRKSHKKIQKGGTIQGEGSFARTYGDPAIPCDSGDIQIQNTRSLIKDYEFQGLNELSDHLISRVPLKRIIYDEDHERFKEVVPLLMREFGEDLMNKQFMPPILSCKIPELQKGDVTEDRGREIGELVNRGDYKFPEGTDWWHGDYEYRIPEDIFNQIIFDKADKDDFDDDGIPMAVFGKLLNIVEALKDMKARKIIHGDIHMSNIVIHKYSGNEVYKLIDLGGITKQDLDTLENGEFMWDLALPFQFDRDINSIASALTLFALPRSVVEDMFSKKIKEPFMKEKRYITDIGKARARNTEETEILERIYETDVKKFEEDTEKTLSDILDFADIIRKYKIPTITDTIKGLTDVMGKKITDLYINIYSRRVNKIIIEDTNTKIVNILNKNIRDERYDIIKEQLTNESKANINVIISKLLITYMLSSPEERIDFVFGHVDCNALASILLSLLKKQHIWLSAKPEAIDILLQIITRLQFVFDNETNKFKTPDMDEIVSLYRDFLTKIGVETTDGGAAGGGAAETG